MKKLLVVAVVLALAAPAAAMAAGATPGKYNCNTVKSVANVKCVNADVKNEGTKNVATVTFGDSKEEWTWDDKTLTQKEFDPTGKVTETYTATATAPGTYAVNCKDKAKNECDAGIDSRNYWKITTTPTSFTYDVYGVGKDKKADATAKAEQRHQFAFTKAQ